MKTSISSRLLPSTFATLLSRSSRMVEALRGATTSAIPLARRARLRLQIGTAIDLRHARQEIVDLGLRRRRNAGARLALRAGGDDAALLQDVFADSEARARLLLVTDQRQMRIEDVVHGVALAFFP